MDLSTTPPTESAAKTSATTTATTTGPSAAMPPAGDGLKFPDLLVYRGYSAPARIEADVHDLEVLGTIPQALNGAYFRASADPCYPPLLGRDIFINGDGMTHMLRFDNGHADLKTRYVRTPKFLAERQARRALYGAYRNPFTDLPEVAGLDRGTANTTAFWHHGQLYALKEDSPPMRLDPHTLDTLGYWDFDGRLAAKTFTAHPKIDPATGEVIAFSYNAQGVASPDIDVHTISPQGELLRSETFTAPYCSMAHDFFISRQHIAFVIYPMCCDWDRVQRGESYWHWDSSKQTVVAIFRRDAGVASLRWYTCPVVAMQTHTFNAWEEDQPGGGTTLHLDHFVNGSGWLSQFPDIHNPQAQEKPPFGERWSFDLADPADRFTIKRLINHVGEMPVVDARYLTRRTRHYWFGTSNTALGPMLPLGPKGPPFTCIGHYDEALDQLDFFYAGPDSAPEEPCFVPRSADAEEGDGWLLTVVGRRAENRSDLVILDARRLSAGPVAVVRMPCRIHEGFHGTWVPQAQLDAWVKPA